MIDRADIEAKRATVRRAYAEYGFNSREYREALNDLDALSRAYLKQEYQRAHGVVSTPYD